MMSLSEEIIRLISLQQEGGYWDFKKEWYTNKTDFLHDIICMSNNLCNRNAYIIIGVDEETNYSIVDVQNDPNRRTTQMVVDFLKDKKFAGGVRPLVHVEQILLYGGHADVIVIENNHNTPYYLTEKFEGVRANHIYTRVMDSNTAIDKSADINNVEYLWRKRFHLDETPIEKFRYYLKHSDDWEYIQDNDMGYFYKFAPEYTITSERDETRTGYEYYIFGQVNTTPSWWLITLKYHQTAIEQLLGLALDGGRSFVVAPSRAYDLYDLGVSAFGYYIQDSLSANLLDFFHDKETSEEYSYRDYLNAIVFFKSQNEQKEFFHYIRKNIKRFKELCSAQGEKGLPYFPEINGYIMDSFKKEYRDAIVIQAMLSEFRIKKQTTTMEDTNHADT